MAVVDIWNRAAADVHVEFWNGNAKVHEVQMGANDTHKYAMYEGGHLVFINNLSFFTPSDHIGFTLKPGHETIGIRIHGWNEGISIEVGNYV